jgi:enoyl-CoA hydratase/carnithine racemase
MNNTTYAHIEWEKQGTIATLTMNRPKKRNALSPDHMAELLDGLTTIEQDSSIAVVIIRGNGPVFSAGHDLSEMHNQDRQFFRQMFDLCSRLMEKIHAIPQPVIAQVHGIATAAGCQLVASCDLAIAADDARFATPGVKIGLFCTTPMVALSRAIPPKKAMEMLLTGEFILADEALRIGLVNRVVPTSELETATWQLAEQISSYSQLVIGLGKQAFYRQQEMTRSQAYAYAQEVITLNATCADAQEGIGAFLEKRAPVWSNT